MPKIRFRAAWTVAFALACAATTIHPESESDAFWHMTLGRAVLRQGSRTVVEPVALPAFTEPCVVPEWLWGVTTYGLHSLGGWPVLVALIATLAAVIALLTWRLVEAADPEVTDGTATLIVGLVASMAMGRMRLRPEAAGTALLIAFMVATLRYVRAKGRNRGILAGTIVGIALVWAQVHGSFVLAPVIYAIWVGPPLAREYDPQVRQVHLLAFCGLVVALTTSAYGLDVGAYIATHAGGDATRHVWDMAAPRAADFSFSNILEHPYGPVVLISWAIGVGGMLHARALWGRELALAALGGVLAFDAVRFIIIAPILAAPLAVRGAHEFASNLRAYRVLPWCGAATGFFALALVARRVEDTHGPLGVIGPSETVHPLGAVAFLKTMPVGTRALSIFNGGGSLGFLLDGRVRTYIDARTPLYFSDSDFAVSREVFTHPTALARALVRYGIDAIVVNREAPVCNRVPPGWSPVVIEAGFTTFVREAKPITTISPCGHDYLLPTACREPGALRDDVARLTALRETPFTRFLDASRRLRCDGALDGVAELVPKRRLSRDFLDGRDTLEAEYLIKAGEIQRAVGVAEASAKDGHYGALGVVSPVLSTGVVAADRARRLLDPVLRQMDDAADPDLRGTLAAVCAGQSDVRCARFHGVRAAVRGSKVARPVLEWLAEHDGTDSGRADARAWLDALAAIPSAVPWNRGALPASMQEPGNQPTNQPAEDEAPDAGPLMEP